jgi:methyl-accepting chemotaxis protein
MSGFFAPAISIANRMSFTAKLLSVVLIFLVPYLLLLVIEVVQSNHQIGRIESQTKGVALVMKLKPMALEVAKHRGNMAQFLSGSTDKEAAIQAIEAKVDEAVGEISRLSKNHDYKLEGFDQLTAQWQELKVARNRSTAASRSFQSHSDLVAAIQTAMGQVAYDFELILQSDAKDHYMENISVFSIPQLAEELGKLRGKGAAALTDKVMTPDERVVLGSMASAAQKFGDRVRRDLDLLFRDANLAGELKTTSQEAHNALKAFFDATNNQILLADEVSISGADYFEAGTKAIDAVSALDTQLSAAFTHSIEKKREHKASQNRWLMLIGLLCTSVGVYLAVGILSALNANAQAIGKASQSLRDGDFSIAIKIDSEDTLGNAADSLTEMIASVAALLHSIQQSAHEVNELSVKLQTVTDSSKHELDQQNLQTQQSASAATEMAATVREVARSCVNVTEATEVAQGSAVEGRAKVNEAIARINTLGTNVEQAREIIGQLQSDVTDIGAVLEVIRSIAEQTNLLALNAAIEAARAGEQGRGFAVVADEVRSLAKRTQDSTAEIRSVIEKLQGRAVNAVNIIHQSFTGAQDSVASAAAAGQSLEKIVDGVELLRDLNAQIATAAEQQATVAEQMSRNTQHLSDSAENILSQVEKTVSYSSSLRKSAISLLENAMKFTT